MHTTVKALRLCQIRCRALEQPVGLGWRCEVPEMRGDAGEPGLFPAVASADGSGVGGCVYDPMLNAVIEI
jgi:hypothetical protein